MERRTSIVGTSQSYTAHVIVVLKLLAISPVNSGKPIFFQLVRMDRDVVILLVTQVSSGFMRGLKVRRNIWASPRTYLVDHGSTPRPIDAAIQDCAVHMTMDAKTLGRHRDCL